MFAYWYINLWFSRLSTGPAAFAWTGNLFILEGDVLCERGNRLLHWIYAGAHLSMVIYRQASQTCELIRTSGTLLSFIEDISESTTDASLDLGVEDILILYTDGITEARNRRGQLLYIQRFMAITKRHATKETLAILDAIMDDIFSWCDNTVEDDMSLVVRRKQ